MRAALLAMLLAACARDHDVVLQLGPDPDHLTNGLTCDKAYASQISLGASCYGTPQVVHVAIDVIELGDRALGCRAEELGLACDAEPCTTVARTCLDVPITVPRVPSRDDATAIGNQIRDALEATDQTFLRGQLPDSPVMVRLVATTEPCASSSNPPPLDPERAVGCAYGCPVVLDDIDTLALSLDGPFAALCRGSIAACAAFPAGYDGELSDPACASR